MSDQFSVTVGAYDFSEAGLSLRGEPTFEDATRVVQMLAAHHEQGPRWMGLFYLDVRSRFPETYSQLLDPRFDPDTWEGYARVVRLVPDWEPEVSFTHHQAIATLDRATQRRLLERAKDERWNISAMRQEVRKASRQTIASGAPRGIYRVAYLDPEYGERTIEELAALPLTTHLLLNAAIFLWCPERFRDIVPALFVPWDCRHVGTIIWHSQAHGGPSAYLSTRHEHLLWLVRGRCPPDELTPMIESVVSVKTGDPGVKPERFRQIIDRLYTHGEKVELFARRAWKLPHWTYFGRQIGERVA